MGKRVLFIEDDRSLEVLYRRAFTRLGYDVALAPDGQKALEAFKERPPDLVVVDVKLGDGMDGLELLGQLLLIRRVPCIINTAYSCFQDSFRSWSADAYVLKSSDLTELEEAARRLLERGPSLPEPIPASAGR